MNKDSGTTAGYTMTKLRSTIPYLVKGTQGYRGTWQKGTGVLQGYQKCNPYPTPRVPLPQPLGGTPYPCRSLHVRAPMESGDPSHMSDTRDTLTRGLTTVCNASGRRDFQSMATSNKIYYFPSHSFEEMDNPHDHNTIETDDLSTPSTTNACAY